MLEGIYKDTEEKMEKTSLSIKKELAEIRTGRAANSLVENVIVECYGSTMPLNQIASIGVPEKRLIVIQPWDKSILPDIEKAFLKSDLALTPHNDGNVIRLPIPTLTEERRKDLIRLVKRLVEEGRISIRNIRRDAMEHLKAKEKEGKVSEDELRREHDRIQKLTDQYISQVDEILKKKEEEILEV